MTIKEPLTGERVKTLIAGMTGEELSEFSGVIARVCEAHNDDSNRTLLTALLNDKARNKQ